MNKNLILKVDNQCFQSTKYLNKIIGTIDIANIAKLINAIGLTANPRKSKTCNTTDQILDTLEFNPEMLRFRSKGILVASSECHKLERNRMNLAFDNESFEGILDGGHNILACGLYILNILEISETRKIKTWDSFYTLWKTVFNEKSFDKINDKLKRDKEDKPENIAQLPIEICFPSEEGYSSFEQNIYHISDARNNNTALSVTTKDNHKHRYDSLKKRLDPLVSKKVAWIDNDDTGYKKSLKTQDIVALTLIPLNALQREGLLNKDLEKINPVNIYSSKARCVQTYRNLIMLESPNDKDGNELPYQKMLENLESNELLMSAFSLMTLIPKLDDYLYINFPRLYNMTGKRFGSCPKVQRYSTSEKGKQFTNRKQVSQFYELESDYKYPKGFYTPIVASLSALMHVKDNRLQWKVLDPEKFLEDNLPAILKDYFMFMESVNSDPQVIGKSAYSYALIEKEINRLL